MADNKWDLLRGLAEQIRSGATPEFDQETLDWLSAIAVELGVSMEFASSRDSVEELKEFALKARHTFFESNQKLSLAIANYRADADAETREQARRVLEEVAAEESLKNFREIAKHQLASGPFKSKD